jgi:hypothetical protein
MKQKQLKLITKTVSVNTRKISVNVTSEQIEDFQNCGISVSLVENELKLLLQEEERRLKRKTRKEKLNRIFGDELQ